MGSLLWIGKMFAKLAILFAKFDSMGVFDALAMLFGSGTEEDDSSSDTEQVPVE